MALFGGVRREINWDGVPNIFAAPNNLPADFFNVNSPRGVVFSTGGSRFRVSANAASATPVRFGNIDPNYPDTFAAFSPERLFTPIGSNIIDINFLVPGTNVPAFVTAFGAIFTDVDLAGPTRISYFDPKDVRLGSFIVPGIPDSQTFEFLGVSFNGGEQIARVRITAGNTSLSAGVLDVGNTDLAVMDDFLYSEPQALTTPFVLEPGWFLLLATGIASLALPCRPKGYVPGSREKHRSR